MDSAPNIRKKAFLALLNQTASRRAARLAIDTEYEKRGDQSRLIIVYENGDREVFHGLRAA